MALDNYRDLSSYGGDFNAGFQFEFNCAGCGRKWKSAFKPYRMGQITGFLSRFSFLIPSMRNAGRTTGNFADFGSRGARDDALEAARAQAARTFQDCSGCRQTFCADCMDHDTSICKTCVQQSSRAAKRAQEEEQAAEREAGASACPNCRTPHGGGRFCAECGFDMASTHKSCPSCAVMLPRQARFCTDCGHGF